MPILWKISQVMFFFEGTTRQIDQQRLGHKFSLVCAMGNHQMYPRGAAVQGGEHKAARNLSRAGGESSHKAASEGKSINGVDRLGIWIMVDGIAAETKTQRRCG
jgi:hypothetical protein